MIPLICVYAGGFLTLGMAIFHTRFYSKFYWYREFRKISPVNAEIIYTVHLALLLLFFIIGFVSILYARELSRSSGAALGLNLLLAMFWLWRLAWQFVYFKTGPGRKNSPLIIILKIVFALLFVSYLVPVLYRLGG